MPQTQTITLSDHASLTVREWSLTQIEQEPEAFMALLAALNAPLTGQATSPQALEQAVRISLVTPADLERIRPADYPDVLEAVIEVNGLRELIRRALDLQLRLHKAQLDAVSS